MSGSSNRPDWKGDIDSIINYLGKEHILHYVRKYEPDSPDSLRQICVQVTSSFSSISGYRVIKKEDDMFMEDLKYLYKRIHEIALEDDIIILNIM